MTMFSQRAIQKCRKQSVWVVILLCLLFFLLGYYNYSFWSNYTDHEADFVKSQSQLALVV